MTLDEISQQAKDEMSLVKGRISELKRLAKETSSMGDRTRLYQRIRKLEYILADLSETVYTLDNYYERR